MTGKIKLNFSGRDCADKSVSLVTTGSVRTVTAEFDFDAEWDEFARTAIFAAGGTVKRVALDDANACVVPWEVLTNCKQLTIGVVGTSGNRVLPSVPVTIPIIEGVCNGGTPPDDPTPDIYAQLLDLAKETQQIAQSVRDDANAGKFNGAPGAKGGKGDPGADGKTPVRGTDYWTDADKAAINADIAAQVAGKVDKIDGKGLSANDYTDADKAAVERILSGEINASYIVDIGAEDKYFDIDIDGMVCLKPAYRGALPEKRSAYTYAISDAGIGVVGTKNSELPERVVIPDMVKGLPVKSMAVGMFCNNMVVKEIVLPAAVTAIPDQWCRESCVEKVLNTQNITSIGGYGFQKSRLLYANFPNLQTILGKAAFYICNNLRFANIGNVTAIPSRCFAQCGSLTEVKSNQAVTSIGDHAFATTESLRKVSFLPPTDKMQSVGQRAFFSTGLNFTNAQWNSFSDNFGTEATPAQIHQDIWSECAVTPHLNGLPTAFGQTDPRWKDLPIYTGTNNYGETQKTYYYGCVFFAIITAYCGLHNLSFDTVQDLAAYLDEHHSGWRPLFSSNGDHIAPFITHLGMTCEQLPFPDASSTDTMAQKTAKLQHLYDQISSGKYITFTVRGGESMYDGHAVVAFGLTEDKRFVISNSAGSLTPNMYDSTQYALPYQNLCIRNPSKPETLNTIIVLGLAEGGEDA